MTDSTKMVRLCMIVGLLRYSCKRMGSFEMFRLIRLCLFVSVFSSLDCQVVQAQIENNEGSSFLAAAVVNSKALQRGDVLVHVTHEADTSEMVDGKLNGGFYEKEEWIRVVFDDQRGRLATYLVTNSEVKDFNRGNDTEIAKVTESEECRGSLIDRKDNRIFSWSKSLGKQQATFPVKQQMVGVNRPIDFRGMELTMQHGFENLKSAESFVEFYRSVPKQKVSLRFENGNPVVQIKYETRVGAEVIPTRRELRFDPVSLMVTKNEVTFKRPANPNSFFEGLTASWQDVDGVFVAKQIEHKRGERIHGIEGKGEVGMVVSRFTFHWNSVNSDLDEDLFSDDQLSDQENIFHLTKGYYLELQDKIDTKSGTK